MMKKNLSYLIAITLTVIFSYSSSLKAQICAGLAVSGDYRYEVYTNAGTVFFKMHPLAPITGSASAIIYVKEGNNGDAAFPGYNMIVSGSDFTFSKTIVANTIVHFYFSYQVPTGGERNSSLNPHDYIAGSSCVTGAPAVSLTNPIEAASFTAPASITLNATASDVNGTIQQVSFYNGSTLLGTDNTNPYSFNWTNITAGSYALTAKATDNDGLSTVSVPVHIVVNEPNRNGYCGTAFNGDYEYKAVTANGNVTFTLHPLTPMVGSAYAFIYLREGGLGAYSGTAMTAAGGDFIYTKPVADSTQLSIYFTYQIPTGGERNSSANPHNYKVGTNCTGNLGVPPTISLTSPNNNAIFTEPATISIHATAADADGTIKKVEFYNGSTLLGVDSISPYTWNWTPVSAGNYTITAKATDNSGFTTLATPVKILVNISFATGFCGTVSNGDYRYKIEKSNGKVVFTFHPLSPIVGCSQALIYVRETVSGVYPGYQMTAIGSDFRFEKTIADSTLLSIYFTYSIPTGGERNSSDAPHAYRVGRNCLSLATQEANSTAMRFMIYPNPVHDRLQIQSLDASNPFSTLKIMNSMGQIVWRLSDKFETAIDVSTLLSGIYWIELTDEKHQTVNQKFIKL
jgi:Bacterial Ig domain/Secretion system C-terminal sorting domain